MELFPAIDLLAGRAVRLLRGDYQKQTVYSEAPWEVAKEFEAAGARCLHLVDLDGAKDGSLSNFDTVKRIIESTGLFAEIGGGIRSEDRIKRYLSAGADRVILGTAALEDFDFLQAMVLQYKEKIAVGVDALDGKVATRGWLHNSGADAVDFCKKLDQAGVRTIIYTDISRDGAQKGTNLEIYRTLCDAVQCDIVASGGVTFPAEISALKETGVAGVILGKALYTGALDLKEALRLAKG